MTASPTIPSNYPGQLEPIRTGVLGVLGRESVEGRKIQSCRYGSRCHSIFCPACLRQDGYKQKDRVVRAASLITGARLKFGTFVAKDVALESLREAGREILQAGGRVFRKLKVDGYAARLEVSFEDWGDKYHAHLHALVDSPSGGRGFVPRDAWRDEWLNALPSSLHPIEGGAHVTPIRDLEATCKYLTKSPFFDHVREEAERVVNTITACKGMTRSVMRGSFA